MLVPPTAGVEFGFLAIIHLKVQEALIKIAPPLISTVKASSVGSISSVLVWPQFKPINRAAVVVIMFIMPPHHVMVTRADCHSSFDPEGTIVAV